MKVNNSYHSFRESRQVEKILPELGTRAHGQMNNILVQLLRLFQPEVEEAWETQEARKLIEEKNLVADPAIKEEDGADPAVEEGDDVDPSIKEDEPASKKVKLQDGTGEDTGTRTRNEEPTTSSKTTTLGKRKREKSSHKIEYSTAGLFEMAPRKFLALKDRDAYFKEFKSYPVDVKSRFCHKKNNLRRMLSYGFPDGTKRKWSVKDLDNAAVLERAMELMLRIRLGASNIEMLPLPQIDFSLAPKKKLERLEKLLALTNTTDQDFEEARRHSKPADYDKTGLKTRCESGTLAQIDALLEDDIVHGLTEQSRKRLRMEGQNEAAKKTESSYDSESDMDSENEEPQGDKEEEEEEDEKSTKDSNEGSGDGSKGKESNGGNDNNDTTTEPEPCNEGRKTEESNADASGSNEAEPEAEADSTKLAIEKVSGIKMWLKSVINKKPTGMKKSGKCTTGG